MSAQTVRVWGKEYEVKADRLSPSVWRATGNYMGELHSVQDRTERSAVKRWREWAEYRGNNAATDPKP